MTFVKYPKIMNHYHNKQINEHLEYNPSCKDAKYIAQIKYDGSNISFIFTPHEEMRIAKRSGLIGKYDNFNGILDILDQYQEFLDFFQTVSNLTESVVQLYGEIFGKGIQNRINYGPDKYIRFYDIRIDDKLLTLREILDTVTPWEFLKPYWVETYAYYNYDDIFSLEVPEEHEGFVIKQYDIVDPNDCLLYIKKKSPKFEEKMKSKKSKKQKETDPEVERLMELFLPYINENRVLSVFSKEGEIQRPEQIGEYIKLVMEDAKEDFELENELSSTDRGKMNDVFKTANREVVKILQQYL
jgi:hypothetical protein